MGSRTKLPAQKDLCVYLVEAGGSQVNGISGETASLVRKCIQDKIFSENADDICIARSDLTKNFEFGPVTWESFKKIETIFKKPKTKNENPVSSLLAVCESMIHQATEDVYVLRKILFFADLNTPLAENEVTTLRKRLDAANICLSVVISTAEESMNQAQEKNLELLRRVLVGDNFVIATYKETLVQLSNMCTKKAPRPSPWNVPLEIGRDIKFNVSGFVSIRGNKMPEVSKGYLKMQSNELSRSGGSGPPATLGIVPSKTADDSNSTTVEPSKLKSVELAKNIVETDTTWKENDGSIVDEDKLGSAYYFGDKLVPFNELEQEDSYTSGEKCLKVLVFCPKELIKPCYLLGDGVTLFYPRDKELNAALLFNALLNAMDKANRFAIVRKVYQRNSRAVIGVLMPNMEKKCLTFAEICFSDDISIPDFPLLVKNVSSDEDGLVEKDQLIDQLISAKSLNSPFVPSEGPVDPSVQQLRDSVANKILGELILSEKTVSDKKPPLDNVDLYFERLLAKDVQSDLMAKITYEFPLKVNVIQEERASGVNIFKKREIKIEEEDSPGGKRAKVEEPIKEECKIENDDDGLNADDLNSEDIEKILYAFDFDHTIIHENSDVGVTKIIDRPIPEDIEKVYNGKNWTEYMDHVFTFLAAEGVTIEDIKGFSQKMEFSPGMEELLKRIGAARQANPNAIKLMVISDANHFFIEAFFEEVGIKPDCIITNPSEITPNGRLHVIPYDDQNTCSICPKNLCKGKALLQYLETHDSFDKVIYTGDGRNDICPVMKLREQDMAFVRKGYGMDKFLQKGEINGQPVVIKAKTILWETATSIQDAVELK